MTYNNQTKLICKDENLGKHYFEFYAIKRYAQNDLFIEDEAEAVKVHNEWKAKEDGTFVSDLNEYVLVKNGLNNFQFQYVRNIQ